MSTHVEEIRVALDDALLGHVGLGSVVGARIYDGMAPENEPLPYVRYGSFTETDIMRFASVGGNRGDYVVEGFTGTVDKAQALEIYRHVKEALHMKKLALAGGGFARGRLELVGTVSDPDGGTNVVMRYTPRVP